MRFFLLFIFFVSSCLHAKEQLIIEPDQGRAPIIEAIQNSHSSIDLVMYGLTDYRILNTLIQAKKLGKNLRILLEPHPYQCENENDFAIKRLQWHKINLHFPNPTFQLTHQKTFLFDEHCALILTFNLTHSSFKNERNFGLMIDDAEMVKEISAVFMADWEHKQSSVKNPHLIWSPDNSREKIMNFIQSAKEGIEIYAQDLADYQIIGALANAGRMGKIVKIILSESSKISEGKLNYLRKANVQLHFNKEYIIHAKVILVDHKKAILGSINFTTPSMQNNRELSVITENPEVIKNLDSTFKHDWH